MHNYHLHTLQIQPARTHTWIFCHSWRGPARAGGAPGGSGGCSHNTQKTEPQHQHFLKVGVGDIARFLLPNSFSRRSCPVFHRGYSRRHGAVQCARCQQWLCLSQHCSGISRTKKNTHPAGFAQAASPLHNLPLVSFLLPKYR